MVSTSFQMPVQTSFEVLPPFSFNFILMFNLYLHKQPPEVFSKKTSSLKFRKIHRKTPVPQSFLMKLQTSGRLLLYLLLKLFQARIFVKYFVYFFSRIGEIREESRKVRQNLNKIIA